jgi:hypothetical protein
MTGFSEVPCALGDMTSSAATRGNLSVLAAMRKAAARVKVRLTDAGFVKPVAEWARRAKTEKEEVANFIVRFVVGFYSCCLIDIHESVLRLTEGITKVCR